jgi:hypothetical protein
MDAKELMDQILPKAVEDNLEIVIEEDGEASTINLGKVLDTLQVVEQRSAEVFAFLLKVKQGVCNLAYSAEEFHARTEDAFRVWRAEEGRVLNLKDDRNPLIANGSKNTNAAIEAYMRSQPEYEEFKNKLSEIETFKNILWTAKKTVESAIEVGKLVVGTTTDVTETVTPDEFDEKLADIAEGLLE